MNPFIIKGDSLAELYKQHTGCSVYESDDESNSSSFNLNQYKPPLYTYDEIQANVVVVEGDIEDWGTLSEWSTPSGRRGFNSGVPKTEPLMFQPDFCEICNVPVALINRKQHDRGKKHKQNLEEWRHNNKDQGSKQLGASSSIGRTPIPESIKKSISKKTIQSDFCEICNMSLQPTNKGHYFGKRHQGNVDKKKAEKIANNIYAASVSSVSSSVNWGSESLCTKNSAYDVCLADVQLVNVTQHCKGRKHIKNMKTCNELKQRETFYDPTNEIINKKLEFLMLSDYCYICNADLSTPTNSEVHYKSRRHKFNLEDWCKEQFRNLALTKVMGKSVPDAKKSVHKISSQDVCVNVMPYCEVCNVNFDAKLRRAHYESQSHIENVNAYCFTCKLTTMSQQQLAEHVSGARHRNKVAQIELDKTTNNLPIPITIVGYDSTSGIPNNTIPSNKTEDKHEDVVREVARSFRLDQNIPTNHIKKEFVNSNNKVDYCNYSTTPTTELSRDGARNHYVNPPNIIKDKAFFCYVCKKKFQSKDEMDLHIKIFPHNVVADLKAEAVAKGVSMVQFWTHSQTHITCFLCNKMMYAQHNSMTHFNSIPHLKKYENWCINQCTDITDVNRKWHFCDICSYKLDGTTNVELHYRGVSHSKKLPIKNIVTSGSSFMSEEKYESTKLTEDVNEKMCNPLAVEVEQNDFRPEQNIIIIEDTCESTKKSFGYGEAIMLRKRVLSELEKLSETIYFSKSVPLDAALKYLTKFNGQIKDFQSGIKANRDLGSLDITSKKLTETGLEQERKSEKKNILNKFQNEDHMKNRHLSEILKENWKETEYEERSPVKIGKSIENGYEGFYITETQAAKLAEYRNSEWFNNNTQMEKTIKFEIRSEEVNNIIIKMPETDDNIQVSSSAVSKKSKKKSKKEKRIQNNINSNNKTGKKGKKQKKCSMELVLTRKESRITRANKKTTVKKCKKQNQSPTKLVINKLVIIKENYEFRQFMSEQIDRYEENIFLSKNNIKNNKFVQKWLILLLENDWFYEEYFLYSSWVGKPANFEGGTMGIIKYKLASCLRDYLPK